jgi:hypothetical protein
MSEAVIQRSLFAVRENGICFRNLFELIFRLGIIRITVGMIGHGKLAVRTLDLDIGCDPRDAEDLVKIALCICGQNYLSWLPLKGR